MKKVLMLLPNKTTSVGFAPKKSNYGVAIKHIDADWKDSGLYANSGNEAIAIGQSIKLGCPDTEIRILPLNDVTEMNSEVKKLWIEALRSGSYAQGSIYLKKEGKDGTLKFDVMGVLCDLYAKHCGHSDIWRKVQLNGVTYYEILGHTNSIPDIITRWAGLTDADFMIDGITLMEMNDMGCPFETLAQVIEDRF